MAATDEHVVGAALMQIDPAGGETYQPIGTVRAMNGLGIETAMVDVTHIGSDVDDGSGGSSDQQYTDVLPGTKTLKPITFELNFVSEYLAVIFQAANDSQLCGWNIQFNNANETTYSWKGYVSDITVDAVRGERADASFTVTPTSVITRASEGTL